MKALVKGGPDEHPFATMAVVLCYMAMCFALCLGCARKAHAAPPLTLVPVPSPVQAAPGDVARTEALFGDRLRPVLEALAAFKTKIDKIDAIDERLKAIEQKIAARPASSETPPSDQPAGPPDPALPTKWEPAAIIKRDCVKCHNAAVAKGGVNYADEDAYIENVIRGFKQTYIGAMPPESPFDNERVDAVMQEMLRVIP